MQMIGTIFNETSINKKIIVTVLIHIFQHIPHLTSTTWPPSILGHHNNARIYVELNAIHLKIDLSFWYVRSLLL